MTAPDLLQVIAVALHWHDIGIDPERGPVCICGEVLTRLDNPEEHQAAVILKAISEAGTVEWGIRYGDGDIDAGYLYKSEALTDIARLRERVQLGDSPADGNEPMTLLTRRRFEHAGPWTAVEA